MNGRQKIGTLALDLDDEWRAVYDLALQGSEIVLSGLTVEPRSTLPIGGLTSRLRGQLKVGTALRQGIAALANPDKAPAGFQLEPESLGAASLNPELDRKILLWVAAHNARLKSRGPRPPRQGDRRLRIARRALLYVQAIRSGDPKPRKRVADLEGASEGSVRDDLHAARIEEPILLTSAGKRRAGGTLTEAALSILRESAQ